FKRITTPTANEYAERYAEYPLNQVTWNSTDETFDFDENADNTIDYRIDNPNFNFKEFLSNLVLRWEYTPGSTLFVVWSQSGSHFDSTGDFNFGNNLEDLSKSKMRNVFMLKFTYRIGR
ncbi:MAG TPA: hydrolase, partial [Bacteroidales bacterium]|nr:hydrolase [Bacteroidales bacterium]